MMEPYTIGLFVHVVGAIGLFVAMGLEVVSLRRLRRAATVEQAREWSDLTNRLHPIFGVSTVLILAAGLYLTLTQWGWGKGWIELSLMTTLVLAVMGPVVNGRRGTVIHRALQAGSGPLTEALRRQIRDNVLWTSVLTMAGLALGIVFLMTVKPGFPGAFAALVVFGALGAGLSLATSDRSPASQPDGVRTEPGR